jgi:hypothetical protein
VEIVNDLTNLRISCKNIKSHLKIVSYRINHKLAENVVDLKMKKEFSVEQAKLKCELFFTINKRYENKLNFNQLNVDLILKNGVKFDIYKSSVHSYTINEERNNVKYVIKNNGIKTNFGIGIIFDTQEENLIESLKVSHIFNVS